MALIDRPAVRRTVFVCFALWAATNVVYADVAVNQVHQLLRIRRGVKANPVQPANPLVHPITSSALERRLGQLGPILIVLSVVAAVAWLVWQFQARRNLLALGTARARRGLVTLPGELLIDLLVPVRVVADILARSSRPEDVRRTRGRRLLLLVAGWAGITAYAVLGAMLLALAASPDTLGRRIARDELAIAVGLVGLGVALVSCLIVAWVASSQRDLAIGEPEHTWAERPGV